MPTDRLTISLGTELAAAVAEHCREHDIKVTSFIRRAVARALKQPKLAETVPRPGRRWPNQPNGKSRSAGH